MRLCQASERILISHCEAISEKRGKQTEVNSVKHCEECLE